MQGVLIAPVSSSAAGRVVTFPLCRRFVLREKVLAVNVYCTAYFSLLTACRVSILTCSSRCRLLRSKGNRQSRLTFGYARRVVLSFDVLVLQGIVLRRPTRRYFCYHSFLTVWCH